MKRIIVSVMLLISSILFMGSVCHATTNTVDAVVNDSAQTVVPDKSSDEALGEEAEEGAEEDDDGGSWDTAYDFTAGNTFVTPVSMEDAEKKIREKGGEALSLTQTMAAYIVTIITIIGVACVAVGTLGKKDGVRGVGIGVLIICAICYVLIFIGPWLLEWFRAWITS